MKRTKKLYLPKWQRWFLIPLFVVIWSFITYLNFFGPQEAREEMGTIGYVMISIILLGLAVMMWLLSSGKLPAYIIEEDDGTQE
ncbi:hypothetical protein IPM19_01650 [bacterium]|nr:MAG: hypothetical protein IPM19_01650 [bacterium]